jgi:hypothetical protein
MDSDKSRSRTRKAKASPRRPTASVSRRSSPRVSAPAAPAIGPEEIRQMIAEAAYYRAERRGFAPGDPTQDWLDAEAEVMVRLRDGTVPTSTTSS